MSRASFSLDVGFPSSSAGVPRSEDGTREALSALVAVSWRRNSGKDGERSVRVMRKCVNSDGPVRGILSRTGPEAGDGRYGEPERVRDSSLFWRETPAGGEVLEERGAADVEVSGVG